jgi:hypothetical protein
MELNRQENCHGYCGVPKPIGSSIYEELVIVRRYWDSRAFL